MKLSRVYHLLPFFKALLNDNDLSIDTYSVVIGQLDPNLLKGQGIIFSPSTLGKRNPGISELTHFSGDLLFKISKKENCDLCYYFIDMLENKNGCCKSVLCYCGVKYYIDRLFTTQFETTYENNEYIFLTAKIDGRIAEIKE